MVRPMTIPPAVWLTACLHRAAGAVEQLYRAFKEHGLAAEDLTGARFQRIARIRSLLESGRLDADLRWTAAQSR
jgi:hypothetical protein